MMTYDIQIEPIREDLFRAQIVITQDDETIIEGETLIGCETEDEALEYVKHVYMVDLRANNPKTLGELRLSWEPEPPVYDEPDDELSELEDDEEGDDPGLDEEGPTDDSSDA